MKLKLLLVFKDEVRKLGLALDLPADMASPSLPGPDSVCILGEIQDSRRRADAISIGAGAMNSTTRSQAFAVFLPVRSVGDGDGGAMITYRAG
jgi:GMP synthase (glutamine-hydrolysing)